VSIRGGWPFRHPPNVWMGVNWESPQAAGLAGWWPTLLSAGASRLRDVSGRGRHLAGYNSPAWTSTSLGQVPAFNNSRYFEADISLSGLLEITMSVWLYQPGTRANFDVMMSNGNWSTCLQWATDAVAPYGVRWKVDTSGGVQNLDAANAVPSSAWTLLSATYDGVTSRLYVNGEEINSATYSSSFDNGNTGITLGAMYGGGNALNTAYMAEPRLYNRALPATVIRSMYAPETRWELYAWPRRRVWYAAGTGGQTLVASGVATGETFGAGIVSPGAVALLSNGIVSSEIVGSHTASPGSVSLMASSVTSEEGIGAATLAPGAVSLSPSGIVSAETFGSATLGLWLAVAGLPSAENVGSTVLSPGAVSLLPSGILSGAAFGSAIISTGAALLQPSGIAAGAEFGSTVLSPGVVSLLPSGILSGATFGSVTVGIGITLLQPSGIETSGGFGTSQVLPGTRILTPSGLESSEVFGLSSLDLQISPVGIVSAGDFGVISLLVGIVAILPSGIASDSGFGTALVYIGTIPVAKAFVSKARTLSFVSTARTLGWTSKARVLTFVSEEA